MAGWETPLEATTDFAYVRFHGSDGVYGGSYSDEQLAVWAGRLRDLPEDVREVYVYFNNDAEGHAVANAKTLIEFITPFALNDDLEEEEDAAAAEGYTRYSFTLSASVRVNPTVAAMSSTLASRISRHRAELPQQRPLPLRPDARNRVERRPRARLLPHVAVIGDGEAVRLVADALHQVERLRRARQHDRLREVLHEELLVLLGQARRRHERHAHLAQRRPGRR